MESKQFKENMTVVQDQLKMRDKGAFAQDEFEEVKKPVKRQPPKKAEKKEM